MFAIASSKSIGTKREFDVLEDLQVLSEARAQGLYGVETAKKHSLSLSQRSEAALTAGDVDDAISFAERDFEFVGRFFGLSHQYPKLSLLYLEVLKEHKRVIDRQSF